MFSQRILGSTILLHGRSLDRSKNGCKDKYECWVQETSRRCFRVGLIYQPADNKRASECDTHYTGKKSTVHKQFGGQVLNKKWQELSKAIFEFGDAAKIARFMC